MARNGLQESTAHHPSPLFGFVERMAWAIMAWFLFTLTIFAAHGITAGDSYGNFGGIPESFIVVVGNVLRGCSSVIFSLWVFLKLRHRPQMVVKGIGWVTGMFLVIAVLGAGRVWDAFENAFVWGEFWKVFRLSFTSVGSLFQTYMGVMCLVVLAGELQRVAQERLMTEELRLSETSEREARRVRRRQRLLHEVRGARNPLWMVVGCFIPQILFPAIIGFTVWAAFSKADLERDLSGPTFVSDREKDVLEPVRIWIAGDGAVHILSTKIIASPTDRALLETRDYIKMTVGFGGENPVVVGADPEVRFERYIDVLNAAAASGIRTIRMAD